MSIRAIGYTRSSIESHGALAAQLIAITEYCLKRGYKLEKNCLDTTDTCTDFFNLFTDLSSGHYDVLIVKSLDRLTRDRCTLAVLRGALASVGIRVETIDSEDTF